MEPRECLVSVYNKVCVALTGVLLVEVTKQYSALVDKYNLVLRLV